MPGAAINPLYAALRRARGGEGGIDHVLARHVEGAAHMAEGYTRARAGNIGVCIGTSGPAGTDMITGLYSASADSIPILCITGQAPVARLHKEDFQAVDIAAIAKPLTKMAVTVLEAAQVPGAFQQAFHLMRSGRPGPVLIDLPFDVQMTEIEFDPDTYDAAAGLQAGRHPRAGREGARHAAGGGGAGDRRRRRVINADAADLLVELAELLGVPVIPTLMGWGAIPDDHPLMAGMAGLQTSHQYGNATLLASDFVLGIGNRWANRHTGGLDIYRARPQVRPRRHRADPDRPGLRARLRHRLRCRRRAGAVRRGRPRAPGRRPAARLRGLGRGCSSASARCSGAPTSTTCRSSRSGSTRR